MKNWILFFLVYMAVSPVWANNSRVLNYTVDNGLINNTVYYIMQDSKGFIWCCTESGVSRFDGKNWDNFTLDEGLADNENFKCYEDSKHRIWFLSSNGKFSYFYKNKIYKVPLKSSSKNIEIGMLYDCLEDVKNNRIYFITNTRKLLYFESKSNKIVYVNTKQENYFLTKYNNEIYSFTSQNYSNHLQAKCLSNPLLKIEKFRFNLNKKDDVSQYYINNANPQLLKKDKVLYLTSAGVFQAYKGLITPYMKFEDFPEKRSSVMLTKIKNDLFAVGANGIYKILQKDSSKSPIAKLFLGDVLANHIILDKAGNYWIATHNKGILFLPINYADSKSLTVKTNSSHNETYCVFKRKNKYLHIGLLNCSNAIYDLNRSIISIKKLSFNVNDNFNRIKNIFEIGNKTIYIGDNLFLVKNSESDQQLFRRDNYFNTLKSYCLNKQKTKMWLVSSQYLQQFDPEKNVITDSIYFPKRCSSIAQTDQNELFVGTIQGLFKRNSKGKFSSMNKLSSLFEAGITGLMSDNKQLWVATHGCGVVLLENDKVKKVINKKNGLISNMCNRLVNSDENLFVCTSNGLSVINKKSFKVTNLTVSDGLISNDIRDVYIDKKQKIYISTDKGISELNWKVAQKSVEAPTPYLRVFQVNDSLFSTNKNQFEFVYSTGFLSLQYAAITYFSPQFVTYHYRLKGENQWQSNSSGNFTFYNLSPGRYQIEVQAKQYKSNWSKSLTINVYIKPLWYQKTVFRALAILLLLFGIIAIAYWRIRVLRKRDREKHQVEVRINELERRTLAAQMNPHFIFNSLNTLQQLVMDKETENALNYLGDFAKLVRQILTNSRKPVITIQEEIEFLKNYLIVEKVRYNGAFNFEFTIQNNCDELLTLPPMLIQPIVENAIKYGVSTSKNEFPLIQISVHQIENYLVFEVSDNGAGIEVVSQIQQKDKLTQSNALEIITERLNLIEINGRKGKLDIESNSNSSNAGTKVNIYIPI
jgi:ligand-binding sensor domain-containing protein